MKMIEILIGIVLCLACIPLYYAHQRYKNTQEFLSQGIKVQAKVIELIELVDKKRSTYSPVFEYMDKAGVKKNYRSNISSYPPSYRVGEIATLVYSKRTDDIKIVSFWELYLWPIVLITTSISLFIVTAFLYYFVL